MLGANLGLLLYGEVSVMNVKADLCTKKTKNKYKMYLNNKVFGYTSRNKQCRPRSDRETTPEGAV